MRIALAGGGTGGHLFPILAVVREIREQFGESRDVEFLYLGPDGELEEEIMGKEFISAKKIRCGKFRRYFAFRNFIDFFMVPIGVIQSLWHLLIFMPDGVFAKGGYASVPVVLAAWAYRIPVIIHESDVMPGIANQMAARFATRIAVSFSESKNFFPERKVFLSGNPIRPELAEGKREEAVEKFSLDSGKKTILVMGGSQGARAINHAIVGILPKLLKKWQLIHITGKNGYQDVVREAARLGVKAGHGGYFPFPFLRDEMSQVFAAADLVVSRAGASSLSEIAANAKPAIVIPIKDSANNHQEQNVFTYSQAGAVVMIEQENLGENILFGEIEKLLENEELRFELTERMKKFHNPEAAKIIAGEVIKIAG